MAILQVDNQAGKPVDAGNRIIIPISQAVKLQPPGAHSILIWNRPVAIVVREEGAEQVLPVKDVTRWIQVLIFGLAFVTCILLWFRRK